MASVKVTEVIKKKKKIKHILSDENLLSLRMYSAWKRSSGNVVNTDHIIGVSVQLPEKLLRK